MAKSERGDRMRAVWRAWWESDEEKDTTVAEFWERMAVAADSRAEAELDALRPVVEAAKACVHGYEAQSGVVDYQTGAEEPPVFVPPFDPSLCKLLHETVRALEAAEGEE